jgi:predicted nucleic acid-binding protein
VIRAVIDTNVLVSAMISPSGNQLAAAVMKLAH